MRRQSFTTSHKQMYIQKMSKQCQVWKTTLTSTTNFLLLLNIMLYGLKHPFCGFNLAFPDVIPPNPHLTHYRVSGKKGKAMMLCKHCSVIAKTLIWYQHCFSHKSKTKHLMRKINSIPAHSSCLDCSDGNYDGEGVWGRIQCMLPQE